MTLLQIENCIEIHRVGSISEAARNKCLSQSSMSQSVSALESELKQKIFLREKKGVKLTPFGEIFMIHAQKIIHNVDYLEGLSKKEDASEWPYLSVEGPWLDISSTLFFKLFLDYIKRQDYSTKTLLRYRTSRKQAILLDVQNEICDMGIISIITSEEKNLLTYCAKNDLKFERIVTFPAAVRVSTASPLYRSKARALTPAQLAGRLKLMESQYNTIFASEDYILESQFPGSDSVHMLNIHSLRIQEITDAFWIVPDMRSAYLELGIVPSEKTFSLKNTGITYSYGILEKQGAKRTEAGELFACELRRICSSSAFEAGEM